MSFGATYLAALNPDFLLLIVNECLIYAPNQVLYQPPHIHPPLVYLYSYIEKQVTADLTYYY